MKELTAIELVTKELELATERYGPFNSAHEGYAIIREELDELWDEVKADGTTHRAVSEAVQTAAMAIRYLIDLCDEPAAEAHDKKVRLWQRSQKQRTITSDCPGNCRGVGCYSG